ncbi:hypothetical protein [Coleofasciculus sp. FACHB-SPT36]|uniref:hypothetical protein n=1 Tax=Cyanophyceae TaxID=3028117 RepID=UPI00168B5652|nr:hypothetical protein [Coleofasciculus sp. FACHB-SPT36]MBD2537761.1 hypothetical protein [Coleofasciculus sp. FACHB-SPT36]
MSFVDYQLLSRNEFRFGISAVKMQPPFAALLPAFRDMHQVERLARNLTSGLVWQLTQKAVR